jgi:hypothetical protein
MMSPRAVVAVVAVEPRGVSVLLDLSAVFHVLDDVSVRLLRGMTLLSDQLLTLRLKRDSQARQRHVRLDQSVVQAESSAEVVVMTAVLVDLVAHVLETAESVEMIAESDLTVDLVARDVQKGAERASVDVMTVSIGSHDTRTAQSQLSDVSVQASTVIVRTVHVVTVLAESDVSVRHSDEIVKIGSLATSTDRAAVEVNHATDLSRWKVQT